MQERTGATAFVALPVSGSQIRINDLPVFVEADIAQVSVVRVDLGMCLMFQFQPTAQRSLYRLSGDRQGRRLVLIYNGLPLGARRLEGVIDGGVLFIFVEVEDAQLPGLAEEMNDLLRATQKKGGFARAGGGY